jgi:hypothetical protein
MPRIMMGQQWWALADTALHPRRWKQGRLTLQHAARYRDTDH